MKTAIDFNVLLYLAFAMALSTYIPSVGLDSTVAHLSSNIMLFLEGMIGITYLFSLFMTLWFVMSSKAEATKKEGTDTKIFKMKEGVLLSRMHFLFLLFLVVTPTFPSQKQLIFLLVANSVLRLSLNFAVKKMMAKANKLLNKDLV